MTVSIKANPNGLDAEIAVSVDTNIKLHKNGNVEIPNGLIVNGSVINVGNGENELVTNAAMNTVVGNLDEAVGNLGEASTLSLAALSLIAYPIGSTYMQFPDCDEPEIMIGGAWEELYKDDGVFFRSPGGEASEFGSGIQGDAIRNITGTASMNSPASSVGSGTGAMKSYIHQTNNKYSYGSGSYFGGSVEFNASWQVPTASENRPRNITVRIWKRTA